MQGINIPSDLAMCKPLGLDIDLTNVNHFVSHLNLLADRKQQGMSAWRDHLFVRMVLNTEEATTSYLLPQAQVMNVGFSIGI